MANATLRERFTQDDNTTKMTMQPVRQCNFSDILQRTLQKYQIL